jgi:integrase
MTESEDFAKVQKQPIFSAFLCKKCPFCLFMKEVSHSIPKTSKFHYTKAEELFLPYLNKEEMSRQEKLTALLKHLATTPNGDMYMQFVLELAKESVTAENLQNLINDGKLVSASNAETSISRPTKVEPAEGDMLGKLSNGKARRVFTIQKKEIKNMPEPIRKLFIANNFVVFYRITSHGYYEARLRRGEMYIEASGRDFETMRKRFIQRLQEYSDKINQANQSLQNGATQVYMPVLFTKYAEEWLSIKKQTTKPSTYKEYERSYNADLKPTFQKKCLHEITRSDLQKYLFGIVDEGKHRKAEKLALMLNCIFDMATDDYGIPSPIKKVVLPNYQTKKGTAFTKEEEKQLVEYCIQNKDVAATDALLVLLYFGLRKSELQSIEIIDGKWLQCETSKELLGQNVVLRRIPFTPQVKKILTHIDFEKAKNVNLNTVNTRLKRLFPNHHPHELRYTFITRCKESGVNPEVVMIWSGHSEDKDVLSSRVNRGYTDFSEDFQLREAEKVNC